MKRGDALVEWTDEHIAPGRIRDKLEQRHSSRFGFQVAIDGGVYGRKGPRDSIAQSVFAGKDRRPRTIIPDKRISRRLQQRDHDFEVSSVYAMAYNQLPFSVPG